MNSLKTMKGLQGLGLLTMAVAIVVAILARDSVSALGVALAVGLAGVLIFSAGVALTLRWQSRTLTAVQRVAATTARTTSEYPIQQISEALEDLVAAAEREKYQFPPEDLAEIVRLVDSRIVGFVEGLEAAGVKAATNRQANSEHPRSPATGQD